MKINYDLVRSPLITEKSTFLSEQNKYVFKVQKQADKLSIKKNIEKIFDVEVKSVNIINIKGKVKKFRSVLGQRSDMKKAVVTLKDGFNIDLSGGIK